MEIVTAIQTVGLPAVMCIWFMARTDKRLSENTRVNQKVLTYLKKLDKKL